MDMRKIRTAQRSVEAASRELDRARKLLGEVLKEAQQTGTVPDGDTPMPEVIRYAREMGIETHGLSQRLARGADVRTLKDLHALVERIDRGDWSAIQRENAIGARSIQRAREIADLFCKKEG